MFEVVSITKKYNGSKRYADVFILTGQSNAVGNSPSGQSIVNLPPEYAGVQNNIHIWWEGDWDSPVAGHFEGMIPLQNTRPAYTTNPSDPAYPLTGWGVEQKWMHLSQSMLNNRVYLIKSADGGKDISHWASPNGSRWVELSRYIRESESYFTSIGIIPRYRGVVWIQGESDKGITGYEGKLRTFINDFRALSDRLKTTPFIMMKEVVGTNLYDAAINAAFDTMANESPYNLTIDPATISGVTFFDNLHYSDDSKLLIGEAIYNFQVSKQQLT